jgi:L-aminopeptidase/D-esterase-like protein
MAATGARNLITDVAGLTVGHAHDRTLASGVTVVLMDSSAVAAASVFGGGPGTREFDAIGLEGSVGVADAIVLSGGSAFGLDAATGVQSFLREQGRGFQALPGCRSSRRLSSSISSMAATRAGAVTPLIATWLTRPQAEPAQT